MSLPLSTRGRSTRPFLRPVLGRVTREPRAAAQRGDWIALVEGQGDFRDLSGYAGILTTLGAFDFTEVATAAPPLLSAIPSFDHLADGDVIALHPNGQVRTLFRRASPHNAIFATDLCNSLCLMCSQPPRPAEDDRMEEHLRLVRLIDPAPASLGITGGEPTLLKDGLLRLLTECRERLPETALHMLSNGRLFAYRSFARKLAEVGHPDLTVAVPLYSDLDTEHDFVVQCRGAFEQTLRGLYHLAEHGVAVEIRIVLHRLTIPRLLSLAEFVYRNLTFASHVALMGLEMTGFTLSNRELLWIDPADYEEELRAATRHLAQRGMPVSIYNLPLCAVPRDLWPFCRRSISDWKNDFLPACSDCGERSRCGGFFTSSVARDALSRRVRPFPAPV